MSLCAGKYRAYISVELSGVKLNCLINTVYLYKNVAIIGLNRSVKALFYDFFITECQS